MKKFFLALPLVISALFAYGIPANAQPTPEKEEKYPQSRFSVGPSASVLTGKDGDVLYGVDAKVGFSDDFSLRPFVSFSGSSGRNLYGAAITYDAPFTKSNEECGNDPWVPIRRCVGGGYTALNVGVGGAIDSSNSTFQPYLQVGGSLGYVSGGAKYLISDSAIMLNLGLNFNF
jgi:hypothetical protein